MPSQNMLRYGSAAPLPETMTLRAGAWVVQFENGDLRDLRVGEKEIIRRVYATVRDHNWGTITGHISALKIEKQASAFQLTYDITHQAGAIDFVWRAEIIGTADSVIRFSLAGEARTTFRKNRLGICVLHPAECAGTKCRATYTNGAQCTTSFPTLVAAEQPVNALHDLQGMAQEIAPGLWAELQFFGAVFETEDQRNWTDASFKTYCPPLHYPFPEEIQAGTKISQMIELRLHEEPSNTRRSPSASHVEITNKTIEIFVDEAQTFPLPRLGLGLASHRQPLTPREIERCKILKPAHLRADIKFTSPHWQHEVQRAIDESLRLAAPLELAIFCDDEPATKLQRLAKSLQQQHADVARWLIFHATQPTSDEQSLRLARQYLEKFQCPMGGGTDADFYQLNQFRPPLACLDFVSFAIHPQAHAFDMRSLIETLAAQRHTLESAKQYFAPLPVCVSPLTFKPRFNPVATDSITTADNVALPVQVDTRQLSLFGAGWTLGSIKYLTAGGAVSATYFETTGWRGVMETEAGSPLPAKFPSLAGGVFPLYHVCADVAAFAAGNLVQTSSSQPLQVEAMLLRDSTQQALLVANLTNETQQVRLPNWREKISIRRLNETNYTLAATAPELYRQENETLATTIELTLSPFEYVCLTGRWH